MTTIAYKDGVLAGDQRVTEGSSVMPGSQRKVWKLRSGWLVGGCGTLADLMRFRDWVKEFSIGDPRPLKVSTSFSGIMITPEGLVYIYEDANVIEVPSDAKFYAIGSGHQAALGALYMGATAKQAVEIACKVDTGSGGDVHVVKLTRRKK